MGGSGSKQSSEAKKVAKARPEKKASQGEFQMPLHYPRYTKADYEKMPEWKVDCLLLEYGQPLVGGLDEKRKSAMAAFLWSS